MQNTFSKVKKNFGFGCLRLPMLGEKVDHQRFSEMIDAFMDAGFNYYDTAQMYIDGQSETALRECLIKRYPRDSFVLVDKLTNAYFKTEEDILPFFESQLEACGVEYFDFYFMHGMNRNYLEKFKRCRAFEIAEELMQQGKIKHLGMSFHDTPEILDQILTAYPQLEVVQIQFNYLDYDDPIIRAKECYEICVKHNKPVIVMEPVRGGRLTELPQEALDVFHALGGSPAGYALRFAAGFDGIMMVLSGMSNIEQMQENIALMRDFKPLDQTELEAIEKVKNIIRSKDLIPCTACKYCVDGCPQSIAIPDLFACYNYNKLNTDWIASHYYNVIHTKGGRKASDCIQCGKCEKACPQHLNIRELLKTVSNAFESN